MSTAISRLAEVFDEDQLHQLADVLLRIRERAIERQCDQEICIGITEKGNPRYIHASDNVKLRKPNGYRPE